MTSGSSAADVPAAAPTIAVLTALPKEYAAVQTMLDDVGVYFADSGKRYLTGTCPSATGDAHPLVVGLLTEMGNNQAAIAAANMLRDFPSISDIVFVGIAGAVPNVEGVERHVRLGDIVVSGRDGVVQYDLGKMKGGSIQKKSPPRPVSPRFAEAVRHLDADLRLRKPIGLETDRGQALEGSNRPDVESDRLRATPPIDDWLAHPTDPQRRPNEPRVFSGAILSGNLVVKDATVRDQLRDECGGLAVEMEGSGLADAAHGSSVPYFVIRGTCDYCDADKNDKWQEHAAVIAAAFLRLLLSRIAELGPQRSVENRLEAMGGALRRCWHTNLAIVGLYLLMAVLMAWVGIGIELRFKSEASSVWVGGVAGIASVLAPTFFWGRLEWVLGRAFGSWSLMGQIRHVRNDLLSLVRQVQGFIEGCREKCPHG